MNGERFAELNIRGFSVMKFSENTFVVHWPPVVIIYLKPKTHGKTFVISLKTAKNTKG